MIHGIVGRAENGKYKVLHFDMEIIRKPWIGLCMPLCFTGARWLFLPSSIVIILLCNQSFFLRKIF